MVTVNFKLSDMGSVQLDITMPVKFEKILDLCVAKIGSEFGAVVVIRDGKVVTSQDVVDESDFIDVYPAFSGG